MPKRDTSCPKGEKATFIVQVVHQQNATLQGTVTWVNEKEERPFRSELELIRIIDKVISDAQNQTP